MYSITVDLSLIVLYCIILSTLHYHHELSHILNQPGKVVNPARGQLNEKNEYFPVSVRS